MACTPYLGLWITSRTLLKSFHCRRAFLLCSEGLGFRLWEVSVTVPLCLPLLSSPHMHFFAVRLAGLTFPLWAGASWCGIFWPRPDVLTDRWCVPLFSLVYLCHLFFSASVNSCSSTVPGSISHETISDIRLQCYSVWFSFRSLVPNRLTASLFGPFWLLHVWCNTAGWH